VITALLSAAVIWCLYFGRLPLELLAPLSAGACIFLAVLGRSKDSRFLMIDVVALTSRISRVNPALKLGAVMMLLLLSIASRSPLVGVSLSFLAPVLVVGVGGLRMREYIRFLALPLSFLLLSGLALLFEGSAQREGLLGVQVFGFWLNVSEAAQVRTELLLARALGALSCLYMLSLTTPLSEIIGVLRRIRCPDVLSDLMYLIYRYVFILLSMHYTMQDAAKSRMGYVSYRTSLRTTGLIYSGMLSRSFRQAGKNFDAMESRCYEAGIHFLHRRVKVTALHAACTSFILAATVCLTILLWR